jgi:hypothetical protein
MAAQDDLRRLSQMDSIYLGLSVTNMSGVPPFVVGIRTGCDKPMMAIGCFAQSVQTERLVDFN